MGPQPSSRGNQVRQRGTAFGRSGIGFNGAATFQSRKCAIARTYRPSAFSASRFNGAATFQSRK